MKRLTPFVPLLLLGALLLFPGAALAGAKRGLDIWWGSVFSALLPCLIAVRSAQALGILGLAARHPRGKLAAVLSFSLLSGAPNGAKLLHALVEDGSLSPWEGQRLAPFVNSVSPAFLLSIIASELLKNKALFGPMAAGFYGCILCCLVPAIFRRHDPSSPIHPPQAKAIPFSDAISSAIEGSMLDMLRIGGCIVFSCTLLSLIQPFAARESLFAVFSGLIEVSTGTSTIAALALPLRLKVSLLTSAAAFGGMSLALQTACCYPALKLGPYLLGKLALGVLSGAACYLLFPLFPSVSAAFASRQTVISRSLSLSALLLSSALSVAFVGVLGLMMSAKNRKMQIVAKE